MNKILTIAAAAILLSACASAPMQEPATADTAAAAIAAAEASNNQAASVGFEWRDTAAIITAAKKAAEAKEFDKAVSLANQAEKQGMNAVKQAEVAKAMK